MSSQQRKVSQEPRAPLLEYALGQPIARRKELPQRLFANTIDLRQHIESCLGDGVRLPLPQVIQRSDRLGHEAQLTDPQGGDDDD